MTFFTDGYGIPVGPGYNLSLGYGIYYLLAGKYPAIHTGWDLSKEPGGGLGLPIYAAANGIVTYARDVTNQSWRNLVIIQHEDPDGTLRCSRYGHLQRIDVQAGQWVIRGQQIGLEGNADGLFYPHLHFDLGKGNLLIQDPTNWPGDNLAYVTTYYDDPTEVYTYHMATNDPIAQSINLQQQSITLLTGLTTTPQPQPVLMYCTAQPSLNVRSVAASGDANTIKGFLLYRESVQVLDAPIPGWKVIKTGTMHIDKTNLALIADAAGFFVSGAYLSETRP